MVYSSCNFENMSVISVVFKVINKRPEFCHNYLYAAFDALSDLDGRGGLL